VCKKLHATYLAYHAGETEWPAAQRADDRNTSKLVGQHAKVWAVDDVALYVGSENLYPADLAEWGVVIDDAERVEEWLNVYWRPLWAATEGLRVSGGVGMNESCTATIEIAEETFWQHHMVAMIASIVSGSVCFCVGLCSLACYVLKYRRNG